MAASKPLAKGHGGRRAANWVPVVEVPPAHNAIDRLINALVEAWNDQPCDEASRAFFGPDLIGLRQRLISDSLYRWPRDADRDFIACWLRELSRAIDGGTFRWTSAH